LLGGFQDVLSSLCWNSDLGAAVHLHQELLLFPLLPSRRLSRRSLREEGGSTMVLEKRK